MDAYEIALKMEREAVDFYRKCAEKSANPVGRKMFLSIAEDEQYHIACALQMQKGEKTSPAKAARPEQMREVFEKHRQEMLQQAASADDLEALVIAMKMEEDSIAFYRNASAQAAGPEEKNFFDCLIRDEEEHFHIFQNTHSFLSDSGNWFMRDEQGIVEG